MLSWIEHVLMVAKTLAIVSSVGFAIAEHRTKKRYSLGLIISGGLALAAQFSEWGLSIHRAHSDKATLIELARARYPLNDLAVVVALQVPIADPEIAPFKTKWDAFLQQALNDPQPWQHMSGNPDEGLTLKDERAKVRVEMSPDKRATKFVFEDDSELTKEIPDADGWISQNLHSILFLVLTRDFNKYVSSLESSHDERSNCDLALLLTPVLSEARYFFTYHPQEGYVEIVVRDETWPVASDTGAITSYLDLPGYHIAILARHSDANVTYFALRGAGQIFARGKNLTLGGEAFSKRNVDGLTVLSHKIEKKDLGVLRSIKDDLLPPP